jgi:uncharacterized membrane protein
MRSKAAIAGHPIHPMLVPLPIGAFFLALVGDLVHLSGRDAFWYHLSFVAIGIGVVTALLAAVFGLIDLVGVPMDRITRRIGITHAVLNVTVVVLYAVSWWIRRDDRALGTASFTPAFGIAVLAFLMLGVSGWLGGELSYRHRVGVVGEDPVPASPTGSESRAAR